MQQYPVTFNEPEAFDKYVMRLKLRIRRLRMSQDAMPDRRPLDSQEQQVMGIIRKQISAQLSLRTQEAREDAEKTFKEAVEVMGERGWLDSFLIEPQIMGVSYWWFAVNALICLIVFVVSSNFVVLFFAAPIIHAIGYVYCTPRLKREREENMQKVLMGG